MDFEGAFLLGVWSHFGTVWAVAQKEKAPPPTTTIDQNRTTNSIESFKCPDYGTGSFSHHMQLLHSGCDTREFISRERFRFLVINHYHVVRFRRS